jgi:hypothetical protein
MARGVAVAPALRPWLLVDAVPLVVVVLIAAHVLALVRPFLYPNPLSLNAPS